MRVLVTGGAGAIGSHLVDALLARGDQVGVLDSFHDFYPREQKERNLALADAHERYLGLWECDIREPEAVGRCFGEARPEAVVHLAARAGVRPSLEEPLDYADVNVNGTVVVASQAITAGVERMVFASSSTVYGERSAAGPFVEDMDTDRPLSPYGASKRAGELFCSALQRQSGLPISCLRFFSVYGPRQRPDLAIAQFASRMLCGEPIILLGDGSVERDFTYISDILAGIIAALDRADGFSVYNLGRGQPVVLNDAIAMLEAELGVIAKRELRPAHPADMSKTWASIERAAAELDYHPQVRLEDGIAEYARWLREQPCPE